MSRRDKLPENPTLKDINFFKKERNWGELPAFYHLVSTSIGEIDGLLKDDGFDNAVKRICNRRNWNLERLEGYETKLGEIVVEEKPRIAIYQSFTDWGFELHAFPMARDIEVDQYVKEHPAMEFKLWDPSTMRLILRVNQLNKFVAHCFEHKDPADKALVMYADKKVNDVLDYLKQHVNVVKVNGQGIRDFYEDFKAQLYMTQEEQLIDDLRPNIMNVTGIDAIRKTPGQKN